MNDQQQISDKVKALAERIISECKQQGFTIEEVERLTNELEAAYTRRQFEVHKDLF